MITLEGWVDIMYYVMDAHSFYNFIYFILLIIVSGGLGGPARSGWGASGWRHLCVVTGKCRSPSFLVICLPASEVQHHAACAPGCATLAFAGPARSLS